MLKIVVRGSEQFDPATNTFCYTSITELTMEHSLLAISKWESKWHVPFIGNKSLTREQTLDYIKCMTLTPNVDDAVFRALDEKNLMDIFAYMENPMSATVVNDKVLRGGKKRRSSNTVTSELVYYWMTALNIPFECESWHFNRLMNLIKVAEVEQQEPQKMSTREAMAQQRSLNAARRAKHNSKG